MGHFICRRCAQLSGSTIPTSFTGTQYQWEKYLKHTSPTAQYRINSIYDKQIDYDNNTRAGLTSGFLSIDDYGRTALALDMRQRVGITISSGYVNVNSAITVVKSNDPNQVHSYPTATDAMRQAVCSCCGGPLF